MPAYFRDKNGLAGQGARLSVKIKTVGRVVLFLLWVVLTLYALVDCIRTPSDSMPGKLPKVLWILLILLITPIGPIAWIVVSRVAAAEAKGGRFEPSIWSSKDHVPMSFGRQKKSDTPRAPDDDPEFLEEVSRKLRDKQREEYQRKQREAEDAAKNETPPAGPEDSDDSEDSKDSPQSREKPEADSPGGSNASSQ